MVALKIFRKSKIVCTLGPATSDPDTISRLINAGMNIARLNFSHGTHEQHKKLFEIVREVGPRVAILCDIQGPKIRIGRLKGGSLMLSPGDIIKITPNEKRYADENGVFLGDKDMLSISFPNFLNSIEPGDFIFINDGLVKLEVLGINRSEEYVECKVLLGGLISDRKGVNIPSRKLRMKNPTEKDIRDLKFIAHLNPEFVAASFVGSAEEVRTVRRILMNEGADNIKIISKIERSVAIENFDEILEESDGIMVARGDLGVEIPYDELPLKQKEIILKSNIDAKPVIVATQMLESMIMQPIPTRAEVSDVFNAIYDRADAVMLSGETSVGKYPVKTVETMRTIVMSAEKHIPPLDPNKLDSEEQEIYETIGHGVFTLASEFKDMNYRGKIICFTRGGKSARMISKYRPPLPIIALTSDPKVARQLNIVWGVMPVFNTSLDMTDPNPETIIAQGLEHLVNEKIIERTDHVIVTLPSRITPEHSCFIAVYYVDDLLSKIGSSRI